MNKAAQAMILLNWLAGKKRRLGNVVYATRKDRNYDYQISLKEKKDAKRKQEDRPPA